jgi:hypothetical protein
MREDSAAAGYPRSVAEAVAWSLARMSPSQKEQIRVMRREDVRGMLHGFQMSARHDFGLASGSGNPELRRSCGSETMVLEDCLVVVLEAIWLELNKDTRRPRAS